MFFKKTNADIQKDAADNKSTADNAENSFLRKNKTIILNILIVLASVVLAAAAAVLVVCGCKVDTAYEDVVSQNAAMEEKHTKIKNEYDKMEPKYSNLYRENAEFSKSLDEAVSGAVVEPVFEDETEQTETQEEAEQNEE